MSEDLTKRGKALEDQYFAQEEKKNTAHLATLASNKLSPVTGKLLSQKVINGVTVDICEESGGVWLDKGELEILMKSHKDEKDFFTKFVEGLFLSSK